MITKEKDLFHEISEQCKNCDRNCNLLAKIIENYDVDLMPIESDKVFFRFLDLSITCSRGIISYEKNHITYLKLLRNSTFKFDTICYTILDIKFTIWKQSISTLSELLKMLYILSVEYPGNVCEKFGIFISQLVSYYGVKYSSKLDKLNPQSELSKKILDNFIKVHDNLFTKFFNIVVSIPTPTYNGEFIEYLEKYYQILTSAMELTAVEIASINRLLVDKKIYITSQVVNWYLKYNYDLVDILTTTLNIDDYELIFAEDYLQKYEYLWLSTSEKQSKTYI